MSVFLPDQKWQHQEGLSDLIKALGGDSMIRFVGGSVRDTLLGLPVNDIDCATRHHPEKTMELIRSAGFKAIPTGIQHGTITALLPTKSPVEITSLRRDVSTDGRHATIAYSDNWEDDAQRRDFTINALYAEAESGLVHDYFGGLADLKTYSVRFIGNPETRIAEDHLRILRFFRFFARFGQNNPDPEALAACIKRANDLMALSRERIASEVLKILALPDPLAVISLMIKSGIFKPILPEITADSILPLQRLVERERLYHLSGNALLRLAALLPEGAEMARSVAQRLRFSKEQKKYLIALLTAEEEKPLSLAWAIGKEEAIARFLLSDRDEATVNSAIALLKNWERPVFPLKGGDLIAKGLPAGPLVATILQNIQKAWVEAAFPNSDWVQEKATIAIAETMATKAER